MSSSSEGEPQGGSAPDSRSLASARGEGSRGRGPPRARGGGAEEHAAQHGPRPLEPSRDEEESSGTESTPRREAAAAPAEPRRPPLLPHSPMRPARPRALRGAFARIAARRVEADNAVERGASSTGVNVVLGVHPRACRVPRAGVLVTTVRLLRPPPERRLGPAAAAERELLLGLLEQRAAAAAAGAAGEGGGVDEPLLLSRPPVGDMGGVAQATLTRLPLTLSRVKFGPRAHTGPVPRTFTHAQRWDIQRDNRRLSEQLARIARREEFASRRSGLIVRRARAVPCESLPHTDSQQQQQQHMRACFMRKCCQGCYRVQWLWVRLLLVASHERAGGRGNVACCKPGAVDCCCARISVLAVGPPCTHAPLPQPTTDMGPPCCGRSEAED